MNQESMPGPVAIADQTSSMVALTSARSSWLNSYPMSDISLGEERGERGRDDRGLDLVCLARQRLSPRVRQQRRDGILGVVHPRRALAPVAAPDRRIDRCDRLGEVGRN